MWRSTKHTLRQHTFAHREPRQSEGEKSLQASEQYRVYSDSSILLLLAVRTVSASNFHLNCHTLTSQFILLWDAARRHQIAWGFSNTNIEQSKNYKMFFFHFFPQLRGRKFSSPTLGNPFAHMLRWWKDNSNEYLKHILRAMLRITWMEKWGKKTTLVLFCCKKFLWNIGL